jgi:hypothetical protein
MPSTAGRDLLACILLLILRRTTYRVDDLVRSLCRRIIMATADGLVTVLTRASSKMLERSERDVPHRHCQARRLSLSGFTESYSDLGYRLQSQDRNTSDLEAFSFRMASWLYKPANQRASRTSIEDNCRHETVVTPELVLCHHHLNTEIVTDR